MAFNFPSNPSLNDTVTFNALTYVWNGTSWESGTSGLSYTEVANRIDYTSDLANSAYELANNSSMWAVRQAFVATANQSTFNITTGYLPDYVDVFYNGIKLYNTEDYTATDGSSVVLTNPAPVNTIIEVLSFGANVTSTNLYVLSSATGFSSRQTFTATSGQTTFTVSGGYRPGYIDVYFNGLKMNIPTDVTATNGTDVVFVGLTPTTGDTIETVAITPDVSIANAVPITGGTISGNITVAGNILPDSTNTYYLGSESQRWHSLFVNSNSIDIDGLVLSNQNGSLAVSVGGAEATPIAGEDTWVRSQANAAFEAANSAIPAFDHANAAYAAANSVNVYGANTAENGFFAIPSGTTAERPANAANGHIRYNTTEGTIEGYFYRGGWTTLRADDYTVEYLIVSGGGSGGVQVGGGGGGGGVITGNVVVSSAISYTVTVGAGGSPITTNATGNRGSNSAFSVYSSYGGGGGGSYPGYAASPGGSGGGGGAPLTTGAAGTPGQGFNGGNGLSTNWAGGGGGGAGQQGFNATPQIGGRGGNGLYHPISGANTAYGGGGGGCSETSQTILSDGGDGGGGGGWSTSTHPTTPNHDGLVNTGGGGGGQRDYPSSSGPGSAGGSGVVILRYFGAPRALGGNITSVNGYTIHTFTGSGTFTA